MSKLKKKVLTKYAESTWSKFTKDDAIQKYSEALDEIDIRDSEIEELKNLIAEKDSQLAHLRKQYEIIQTDEGVTKEVLRLYAQGKSTGSIYSYLNEVRGLNVESETISNVIDSLLSKDLEGKFFEYYKEQLEAFKSDDLFNEEEFRKSKLREIDNMLNILSNEFYARKHRKEDLEDSFKIIDRIASISEKMSKLMKGVGDSNINIQNNINDAKKIKEELENKSRGIIEGFSLENIENLNVVN